MSTLLPSLPLPAPTSTIHLTALSLPTGLLLPDVWSQTRLQPATLSLVLHLGAALAFTSASASDALDASTVHYGTLAKRILASCRGGEGGEALGVAEALGKVEGIVRELAGGKLLRMGRVEVGLEKGSMFGEEVRFVREFGGAEEGGDEEGRFGVEVRGVKVMTLLGVNAYERQGRQPVVVGLGLWTGDGRVEREVVEGLLVLERVLVDVSCIVLLFSSEMDVWLTKHGQIIEPTTYETLETLIEYTVTELRSRVLDQKFPGSTLRLKMVKPRAIAWADAPGLEVVREIPGADAMNGSKATKLCLVKPYAG